MGEYRINFAGFGIEDGKLLLLNSSTKSMLEINQKGEIWNQRTGKVYEENIIRLLDNTTYEMGFSCKIDGFITMLEENPNLKDAFINCVELELQIRVTMTGEETGIPSIQISSKQMLYLAKLGVRIDIDIFRMI